MNKRLKEVLEKAASDSRSTKTYLSFCMTIDI
jgi:hypothetical protein